MRRLGNDVNQNLAVAVTDDSETPIELIIRTEAWNQLVIKLTIQETSILTDLLRTSIRKANELKS